MDKPQPQFPIERISEQDMRERFNRSNYAERLASGALIPHLMENRHPALIQANEPYCTQSQFISYRDPDGNEVARVHQYLRPDGTIGASGKPDPKRFLEDGILYRLIKKHKGKGTANQ